VVEQALFGMEPWAFHLTSLLIHAGSAVALLLALLRLGTGETAATLAAIAFALHPACAEPVSWISGRKDLLSALLVLCAVASFLGIDGGDRRVAPRMPALVLMTLAMLAKPSVVLVPSLPLALDARKGRVAWMWAGCLALGILIATADTMIDQDVGTVGNPGGLGPAVRALAGAGWHGRIIAWPFSLLPKYLDPPTGVATETLVGGAAAVAVGCGLLILAWVRGHPARVGLLLAALAYAPVSGIVPLVRQYADCYVYLPIAGLALAAGATASSIRTHTGAGVARVAGAGTAVLVLSLGLAAREHAGMYRDGVSLWSAVYRAYPDSPQVCRNLGNAYLFDDRDQPESAIRIYRHCIRTLGHREFFVRNLAIATARAGHADEAAALMEEASRSPQAAPRDTMDDDGR
jgi:hypothetical protein